MKTVEGIIAFDRRPHSLVYARCAKDTEPTTMGSMLLAHYDLPDDVRMLTELRTIYSMGPTVGVAVAYETALNDDVTSATQCISPHRDGREHAPPTGASSIENLLQTCLHYDARHCYVFDPLRGWHVAKHPFPERKQTVRAYSLAQFFQPLTAVLCTPRTGAGVIVAYLEWLTEQNAPRALDPVRQNIYAERTLGDATAHRILLSRWNDALAGDHLHRDGEPAGLLSAYRQDCWWQINKASPEGCEARPET